MKVICVGFPKTGTKSLHTALVKLGYTVYDSLENATFLQEEWQTIFEDGWSTEVFRKMYENVDAVADIPACYFWEEIHKAFPEAKIILTIRENEDVWLKSFKNHMETRDKNFVLKLMEIFSLSYAKIQRVIRHPNGEIIFGNKHLFDSRWFGRKMNGQLLNMKYRSHNNYVLQNAPKDKLLVYNVTDGWEPLCQFLGVPVPNEVFPRRNVSCGIVKEWIDHHPIMIKMKNEMLVNLFILFVLLILIFPGFLFFFYI